ncbi:MAG: UbiA family prenyltransferase [Spirosomataceae bacterium]
MAIKVILILLSSIIPVIAFFFQPILVREIIRDLRVLRILHYVALTGLGLALEDHFLNRLDLDIILKSGLFIISLIYAAVFAIISNNFEDLETDKISNQERPLVQNRVNRVMYRKAGVFCQCYALLIAAFIDNEALYCLFFISLGYYVYSCEPFRFKKIPFIAKIIIGFNSLAVAVAGFQIAGGSAENFPIVWALYILIPLSLSANFVDLKDIEGDKIMNVRTLPILLGESKAKKFIAFMTAISYLIPGILLDLWWLYPIIFTMMGLHIWFLYRKPYREKPIFLIYVSSIFGLNTFLIVSKYL